MMQGAYPEVVENIYIMNAPWMFACGWRLAKPLIAARTLEKIAIFGGGDGAAAQKQLVALCGAEQLPKRYGGLIRDEECLPVQVLRAAGLQPSPEHLRFVAFGGTSALGASTLPSTPMQQPEASQGLRCELEQVSTGARANPQSIDCWKITVETKCAVDEAKCSVGEEVCNPLSVVLEERAVRTRWCSGDGNVRSLKTDSGSQSDVEEEWFECDSGEWVPDHINSNNRHLDTPAKAPRQLDNTENGGAAGSSPTTESTSATGGKGWGSLWCKCFARGRKLELEDAEPCESSNTEMGASELVVGSGLVSV